MACCFHHVSLSMSPSLWYRSTPRLVISNRLPLICPSVQCHPPIRSPSVCLMTLRGVRLSSDYHNPCGRPYPSRSAHASRVSIALRPASTLHLYPRVVCSSTCTRFWWNHSRPFVYILYQSPYAVAVCIPIIIRHQVICHHLVIQLTSRDLSSYPIVLSILSHPTNKATRLNRARLSVNSLTTVH